MIYDSLIKILGSNKDRIKINVNKNMIKILTKKKTWNKINATNEKDIGEDKQNEIGCLHLRPSLVEFMNERMHVYMSDEMSEHWTVEM